MVDDEQRVKWRTSYPDQEQEIADINDIRTNMPSLWKELENKREGQGGEVFFPDKVGSAVTNFVYCKVNGGHFVVRMSHTLYKHGGLHHVHDPSRFFCRIEMVLNPAAL